MIEICFFFFFSNFKRVEKEEQQQEEERRPIRVNYSRGGGFLASKTAETISASIIYPFRNQDCSTSEDTFQLVGKRSLIKALHGYQPVNRPLIDSLLFFLFSFLFSTRPTIIYPLLLLSASRARYYITLRLPFSIGCIPVGLSKGRGGGKGKKGKKKASFDRNQLTLPPLDSRLILTR